MAQVKADEEKEMAMSFLEHLRQFLGEAVDEGELASIALTVLAMSIKRLKLAIAEHVCEARGLSESGDSSAAGELSRARALKTKYDAAVGEYERVRGCAAGVEIPGLGGDR